MHARLVLLHRRATRGQRKNPPQRDGTRKVTGWPPRHGCAGWQRRQRAAAGLFSEKNASCGEGNPEDSCKMLGGLEQGAANSLKTTSPFAKTTSLLGRTMSRFGKTISSFARTVSL